MTLARLAPLVAIALPGLLASQQPAPRPPRPAPPAAQTPAAQTPAPARPAPSTHATLVGAVFDSIYWGPLVGATVILDGTTRSGETNAQGNFRIDSVPVGAWRLALFHPLLDTIGLSIATQAIRFGADSTQFVELVTPSLASIAGDWCPAASRRLGPGAVLGRVMEAETSAPAVGARASLVYEEVTMLGGLAVQRGQRVRTATVDSAGRIALCGLPGSMTGTLVVERGGAKTPEVPVELDESGHALRTLLLATPVVAAAPGAAATRLRGTATVRGRVMGPDARPMAGARVSVEGTGAEATTDASGQFAIGELPAGTWTVLARRVGSAPDQRVLTIPGGRVTEVSLTLRPQTELSAVVVRDTVAMGLQRVGFENRKNTGMGHYVTPDEIARRNPQKVTDLLRGLPGVLVSPDGRGRQTLRSTRDGGQGCMELYVDGSPSMDGGSTVDEQIPARELAAVEVYTASTVPAEFTRPGRTCGVIVVWTKARTRVSR